MKDGAINIQINLHIFFISNKTFNFDALEVEKLTITRVQTNLHSHNFVSV